MIKVPKDLGQRIVEAANMAASEHLEQEAKDDANRARAAEPMENGPSRMQLRGLVGDIVPGREAA